MEGRFFGCKMIFGKTTCLLLAVFFLLCQSCKKDTNATQAIPANQGMMNDYGFKPGSYWVFYDSLTGNSDSAYVASFVSNQIYESCVVNSNTPKHQQTTITINVSDGNASDSETWYISLVDSVAAISFTSNKYAAENNMGYRLFTYPIRIGKVAEQISCLMSEDSASVFDIYSRFQTGDLTCNNTTAILETTRSEFATTYNDWFFISPEAGFVKVAFNHPSGALQMYNPVLTLLRYHVVK